MSILLKSGMTAPMITHTPEPWTAVQDGNKVASAKAEGAQDETAARYEEWLQWRRRSTDLASE